MSTRCQLIFTSDGAAGHTKGPVYVYRHCDGYPSSILPDIKAAFEMTGGGWVAGRIGKAIGYLCAVEPGQFEPEQETELHGDIEYLYKIHLTTTFEQKCTWEVTVCEADCWDEEKITPICGPKDIREYNTTELRGEFDEPEIEEPLFTNENWAFQFKINSETDPTIEYIVSGYTTTEGFHLKCSCPDHVHRNRHCKHILKFKELRVMKEPWDMRFYS